ncbi:acyltransferase [Erwinia sp. P6884]|uniref:acyltransferase family protein n=1 Tax=Erwinia sp. P6884 TaxID=3141450 RepID=UPI00318760B4
MKNPIQSVTGLRALACMLVVICHAKFFTLPQPPAHLPGIPNASSELVRLAAALFFMMTGYLLTRSQWYEFGTLNAFAFLKKKFARILPVYYLFTLVAIILWMAIPSVYGVTNLNPADNFLSLLFIPGIYIEHTHKLSPVLYTGWGLCLTVVFYIIFSIGLRLPRKSGLNFIFLTVVTLVAGGEMIKTNNHWFAFYTDPLLLYFLSGMLCFIFQPRLSRPWPHGHSSLLITAALMLLAVTTANEAVRLFALTFAFYLLTFFSFNTHARSPVMGLITALSRASFTVVLSHTLFMDALASLLPRFMSGSGQLTGWVMMGMLTVGSTGLGYFLYWLIEKKVRIKPGVKAG